MWRWSSYLRRARDEQEISALDPAAAGHPAHPFHQHVCPGYFQRRLHRVANHHWADHAPDPIIYPAGGFAGRLALAWGGRLGLSGCCGLFRLPLWWASQLARHSFLHRSHAGHCCLILVGLDRAAFAATGGIKDRSKSLLGTTIGALVRKKYMEPNEMPILPKVYHLN